jgi:hypothetical protein
MLDLLLTFTPNLIYHIITGVGILLIFISFTLKAIPVIGKYFEPIRVIAFCITIVGAWYEGGIYVEKTYKEKLEQKVAAAEQHAKEQAEELRKEFEGKVKVVKDTKVVIKEKIKTKSVLIDAACKVPLEMIDILNEAATLEKN